jgi:cytochrome c oxidase assembly protein subunit 15
VLRQLSISLAVFMLGTVVIGMSMDRLHMPMFSQPLHLLLASLIFGTQLAILLVIRHAVQENRMIASADKFGEGSTRSGGRLSGVSTPTH